MPKPNPENAQRTRIIEDLRRLVGYRTVTLDPSDISPSPERLKPFQDAMAYLKQRAIEEGKKRGKQFNITELESNGRPILIIGTHETKTPDIAILTHIDVTESHSSDQFELKIENGDRAYGKGAYDMKYSAVAGLDILVELPKGDDDISVSLMFTSDEEKGAKDGTQVLYHEGYKPDFLIIPDGSRSWTVTASSRALWHFRIEDIQGRSTHASRPWEGENAVRRAYRFDEELATRYPNPTEPSSAMTLNLADMGAPRNNDAAHNVVPDKALLKYDARFGNQEEMNAFINELENSVSTELPGARIETDVRYPYHESDLSQPDAQLLMQIIEERVGHKPEIVHAFGGTDAVHFPDVPSFIMLAEGDGAHTPNEWVSINGITTFILILKEFIGKKAENRFES